MKTEDLTENDVNKLKLIKQLLDKEETSSNMIYKRMNDINTFQCADNELYLRGQDEMGEDFTIVFDAFDFLRWIDSEQIQYIKKQTIKYIKQK
jgi:acyl-ACP thioesterase